MAEVYKKLICDPYEWLPEYGESEVSYYSDGGDLVLTVKYDKEIDGKIALASRTMTFKHKSYFAKGLFPGYGFIDAGKINLSLSDKCDLGTLFELVNSEWAKESMFIHKQVSGHQPPNFKHFRIYFLGENQTFDILAEDVMISNEIIIRNSI